MSLTWLNQYSPFPAPNQALEDPPGLLAAGGDLSPQRLINAYRQGIFPWYMDDSPLLWWSPDPRCILDPSHYQPARSLRKAYRQANWSISVNRCFKATIEGCAGPRSNADGTWITADMQAAYLRLHRLGWTHSIEVWRTDELVGGLYGVSVGTAFCAESMYSRCSNASKMAIWALMTLAKQWSWCFVDTQMENPHLLQFGTELLPRDEYLARLNAAVANPLPDWRLAESALAQQGFCIR
jgi:leucyl/phenylalanyl-tRNA--protein transferase